MANKEIHIGYYLTNAISKHVVGDGNVLCRAIVVDILSALDAKGITYPKHVEIEVEEPKQEKVVVDKNGTPTVDSVLGGDSNKVKKEKSYTTSASKEIRKEDINKGVASKQVVESLKKNIKSPKKAPKSSFFGRRTKK